MSEFLNNHQHSGKYININGLNIFTRDEGIGETIVLIHGLFSTSYSYRKIIPILSKSYRVVALDLPGIGFSEKSETIPISVLFRGEISTPFKKCFIFSLCIC